MTSHKLSRILRFGLSLMSGRDTGSKDIIVSEVSIKCKC